MARSERREEILATSLRLFAEHGLHGVTTRMIAEAAGVSEALLYRHFRGKEELFEALQSTCLAPSMGAAERLAERPASTETLVMAVHLMVREIIMPSAGPVQGACIKRLVLGSLIDNGAFARGILAQGIRRFFPRFLASLSAAEKSGDLVETPSHPALRVWFTHHIACMVSNFGLPNPPVVDYGLSLTVVADECTRFALRGLGVTTTAINRYFLPRVFEKAMKAAAAV